MEGLNFATEFAIVDLGYSYSEEELWNNFKKKIKKETSYHTKLIDYNTDQFWLKLNFAFEFRGDGYSGFTVIGENETRLLQLQQLYRHELKSLFESSHSFKHYPHFDGLNYFPVFWGYNILFENKNNWFMVIGSASD